MKQCEWERFHKLLNDNNLWSKLDQENKHSLLSAVSTALFFTSVHSDAVKKMIKDYLISQMQHEKCQWMSDMSASHRDSFIKNPEQPWFEDILLQIVSELFKTRIELFYVSPRGLSTKLFFQKTSKKIRIARYSCMFYAAVFRHSLRGKASFAKFLIHNIINTVLGEQRLQNYDKMYPNDQLNLLENRNPIVSNTIESGGTFDDFSASYVNANLRSFSSMESSAKHKFSFKWSRSTNPLAEESQPCTKFIMLDSLFDLNPKGPLAHLPLTRGDKGKSETLATGLPLEKNQSINSQSSQSDVFEVIELTTREISPPKHNIQLTGLSKIVNNGFETLAKEVEKNQLSSIFGFVDNRDSQEKETKPTWKLESQVHSKKPLRSKLKATVESFVPNKALESIFVELPRLKCYSQPISQTLTEDLNLRNEMFLQNLSIIKTPLLLKSHPLKEAFTTLNKFSFQKSAKQTTLSSQRIRINYDGPSESIRDYEIRSIDKSDHSSKTIAQDFYELSHDILKNERDEVIETEARIGVLKFFDEKNGYGFITVKGESDKFDVFVYRKDLLKAKIKMDTIRQVKKGAVLTFCFQVCHYVGRHNVSRKAKNIKLCTEKLEPSITTRFDIQ